MFFAKDSLRLLGSWDTVLGGFPKGRLKNGAENLVSRDQQERLLAFPSARVQIQALVMTYFFIELAG
jgi:hypothetical protein